MAILGLVLRQSGCVTTRGWGMGGRGSVTNMANMSSLLVSKEKRDRTHHNKIQKFEN